MKNFKNITNYILEKTKMISETDTNRSSASLSEYNAFNNISSEAQNYADSDTLKTVSFMVSNKAFFVWSKFLSVFLLISYVAYFFIPIMSWFFAILGILPLLFEKIAHVRVFDFVFEQQLSRSFYIARKPKNTAQKRVIFSSNIDAPTELTLNKYGGYLWFITVITFCSLGFIFILTSSLVAMIITKSAINPINFSNHKILTTVHFIGMIFIPFFIALAFTYNEKTITSGVSSSLTSCYLSVGILKYLNDNKIDFNNTEVGIMINGSSNAGLRGSKAWMKQNPDFGKDIPTYIINHSNLFDIADLSIISKDHFGLSKVDNKAKSLYEQAAARSTKILHQKTLSLSTTDSYIYNKKGVQSVSIMALNKNWPKEYNTTFDTLDQIDIDCLTRCFELSLNVIQILDEENTSNSSI